MNKDMIILTVIMICALISGCAVPSDTMIAGAINEVHHGTTLKIIEEAINGGTWSFIYYKPGTDMWTLGKIMADRGMAFINISASTARPLTFKYFVESTGGKANLVSGSTFKDFMQFMRDHGWKSASAAKLAADAPKIAEMSGLHKSLFWSRVPMFIIVTAPMSVPDFFSDPSSPVYREIKIQ